MPSRELRRARARKGETVSDVIEKRKESHPLLYGFSVIVLVVIVVTFIGSPVAGKIGGMGSIVFGTYEGRDIAYSPGSYFAQQRDRIAAQVRDRSNQTQDSEATTQMIWYQAFRQTAMHVAIMVQVDKAGMHVSEDAVDKVLITNPAYLEEGKFSEEKYRKSSGAERATARRLYREDLLSGAFASDLLNGVLNGPKEKDFIQNMVKPERSFSFVSFTFSNYPGEEVRKYGEANKALFRKVKVSRILVKSGEKEAAEIRRKIVEKTSSFEELAKTHSKDGYAEKGGDMGWRYAYDLQAEFEKKEAAQDVFALKSGEVSDVLKGSFGWMIFRCDSEPLDADFADSGVIDVVKAYLTRYEKGKMEDYFMAKAGAMSSRATDIGLEAAAKEVGAKVETTDFFPINLQNVFSFAPLKALSEAATPTGAVYSEDFFVRGFSLAKNKISAPIVLDDQILVIQLKAERQMPDKTLEIVGNWTEYMASQSAQSDLSDLLMAPGKLKDNFAEAFGQLFVSPR